MPIFTFVNTAYFWAILFNKQSLLILSYAKQLIILEWLPWLFVIYLCLMFYKYHLLPYFTIAVLTTSWTSISTLHRGNAILHPPARPSGCNVSTSESCYTSPGCCSAVVFWSTSVILFENKLLLYRNLMCVSSSCHLHPVC